MEIWEVRDGVVDLLVFKGHYFDFWIGLKRAIVTACSDFYFARYFGIAMDFVAHYLNSTKDFISQIPHPTYKLSQLHRRATTYKD